MIWDARQRRYEDDNGRPLTPAEVRKRIDEFVSHQQNEVERQAKKLSIGAISPAVFFIWMRQKITTWHSITAVVAYGGEDQMTPERWKRVNEKILSELTYLEDFEKAAEASFVAAAVIASGVVTHLSEDIPAGLETLVEERATEALLTAAPSEVEAVLQTVIRDTLADSVGAGAAASVAETIVIDAEAGILSDLIGGTIANRAQMYADSAFATYQNSVTARESDEGVAMGKWVCAEDEVSCDGCLGAATEDFIPLEDIPDIGSHECLFNCRCDIFYLDTVNAVPPEMSIDLDVRQTVS